MSLLLSTIPRMLGLPCQGFQPSTLSDRSKLDSNVSVPDQILIFPKQPPTCAQQVWCCVPPALESGPMGPDQLNLHRASGHLVQVIVAGSKMPTLCVLYQAVVVRSQEVII